MKWSNLNKHALNKNTNKNSANHLNPKSKYDRNTPKPKHTKRKAQFQNPEIMFLGSTKNKSKTHVGLFETTKIKG